MRLLPFSLCFMLSLKAIPVRVEIGLTLFVVRKQKRKWKIHKLLNSRPLKNSGKQC